MFYDGINSAPQFHLREKKFDMPKILEYFISKTGQEQERRLWPM